MKLEETKIADYTVKPPRFHIQLTVVFPQHTVKINADEINEKLNYQWDRKDGVISSKTRIQ